MKFFLPFVCRPKGRRLLCFFHSGFNPFKSRPPLKSLLACTGVDKPKEDQYQSETDKASLQTSLQTGSRSASFSALALSAEEEEQARRHALDYSEHPLVLGDGFEEQDVRVYFASPYISDRMGGLVVATINKHKSVR